METECFGSVPDVDELPEIPDDFDTSEFEDGEVAEFTNLDYVEICHCIKGFRALDEDIKYLISSRSDLIEDHLTDWTGGHRRDYDVVADEEAEELRDIGEKLLTLAKDLEWYAIHNLSHDKKINRLL